MPMLGEQERMGEELFVACSLRDLIPEDYILKKVNRVLDLRWLRAEVADCYCADNGRPGIDPEAAVRLMLAGFFHGIVHDRKLLREAGMHLGIRWFAGYSLHEALPDHSSLTRLRQRWGAERFRKIFERTIAQCAAAGLIGGQTLHVDSTLIRADVSFESLVAEHTRQVEAANGTADDGALSPEQSGGESNEDPEAGPTRRRKRSPKKRSTSDADCTLSASSRSMLLLPCYKQHTAVDDRAGVVVDAEVTTGERNEGREMLNQLDRVEARLGTRPACVTADAGYAHSRNWAGLEARGIEAVIPPQPVRRSKAVPASKFKYDARHNTLTCPRGQRLRCTYSSRQGQVFRSSKRLCRHCVLREDCVTAGMGHRAIIISEGFPALLRARRKYARHSPQDVYRYGRHRWIVEGRHGEAKTQHGLARAVRRGLDNVRIQAYLTAAVMNLKRLARWVYTAKSGNNGPCGDKKGRRAWIALIAALCAVLRAAVWRSPSLPKTHCSSSSAQL
jgi:IS5 family transposase